MALRFKNINRFRKTNHFYFELKNYKVELLIKLNVHFSIINQ